MSSRWSDTRILIPQSSSKSVPGKKAARWSNGAGTIRTDTWAFPVVVGSAGGTAGNHIQPYLTEFESEKPGYNNDILT